MNTTNPSSPQEQELISSPNKEKILEESNTGSATTPDSPNFGWSKYAERVSGRFAMIGFSAILIIESLSHKTFLQWSGLLN